MLDVELYVGLGRLATMTKGTRTGTVELVGNAPATISYHPALFDALKERGGSLCGDVGARRTALKSSHMRSKTYLGTAGSTWSLLMSIPSADS